MQQWRSCEYNATMNEMWFKIKENDFIFNQNLQSSESKTASWPTDLFDSHCRHHSKRCLNHLRLGACTVECEKRENIHIFVYKSFKRFHQWKPQNGVLKRTTLSLVRDSFVNTALVVCGCIKQCLLFGVLLN